MKRLSTLVLTAAVCLSAATPAPAVDLGFGLFKRRGKEKEKAPEAPQQTQLGQPSRTQQLVAVLQNDPDEARRLAAAEELGKADPRSNADVVPGLIGSLQRDPSPAVRARAAGSLGQLKPVSQPAGIALETVLQTDPDAGVRDAVKSALWQYHLNGYRTPAGQPLASQSAEPPLAARAPARPVSQQTQRVATAAPPESAGLFRPISNSVGKGAFYAPTPEPPLARKPAAAPKADRVSAPAPNRAPEATTLPLPLSASAVPEPVAAPVPTIPAPMPATPTAPTAGAPTNSLPPISVPTLPQGPTVPVPPRSGF